MKDSQLFECPTCKKKISLNATQCPKCGEQITDEIREAAIKKDAEDKKIRNKVVLF